MGQGSSGLGRVQGPSRSEKGTRFFWFGNGTGFFWFGKGTWSLWFGKRTRSVAWEEYMTKGGTQVEVRHPTFKIYTAPHPSTSSTPTRRRIR